MGVTTEDSYYT